MMVFVFWILICTDDGCRIEELTAQGEYMAQHKCLSLLVPLKDQVPDDVVAMWCSEPRDKPEEIGA